MRIVQGTAKQLGNMPRVCCGLTRAGRPCSITSTSSFKDEQGRSVASPLRRGGDRCLYHAQPFSTHPAELPLGPLEILFLDTETTGTDVATDRVVELSAVQALGRGPGASFSSVVAVDQDILSTQRARDAAAIHGICDDEIRAGPTFRECWGRFLAFVDSLLRSRVQEMSDSSDDEPSATKPAEEQATVLIAAHNGKFDFALLLFECHRHSLDVTTFENWLFVDTLRITRAVVEMSGSCHKLQCIIQRFRGSANLTAHRARDDCIALMDIIMRLASHLDVPLGRLLQHFAERFQLSASMAQVSVLSPS